MVPRVALAVAVALLASCRYSFEPETLDASDGTVGTIDAPPDAPDRPNRVFATSPGVNANLGGLVGADAICQAKADAAGLGGTWLALLWTSSTQPSLRFASWRGWVDLMGTPIADRASELDTGNYNPIRYDERGSPPARSYAWRGTRGGDCGDWTSTGGQSLAYELEGSWLNDSFVNCTDTTPELLCAETGHVAAVTIPQQPGRIAFVSSASFVPSGGLSAADAICQNEATAAGLGGTFRALLATSTATAESRFSTTGLPWQRVDGVRITATAADLVGPTPVARWDSFIARTATGQPTNARIWYGSAAANCNNWVGGTIVNGTMGKSHLTYRSYLSFFGATGCGSSLNLICLQQ